MVTRIMKRPVVQPARLERLTDDQLADVLKRYPWFDTARLILQSRTTAEDPQLRLRLQIAGWPEILLARPDTARSEADVIDRFLSREFRRIVPDPASFPAGIGPRRSRAHLGRAGRHLCAAGALRQSERDLCPIKFAISGKKCLFCRDYCRAGHEKVRKVNGKKITNV